MNRDGNPREVLARFYEGTVIPAMPLALHADRSFDEVHQRAILRYYIDSGSGGVAVGVHSTQFEIRDPELALFEPVLEFASRTVDEWAGRRGAPVLKVAGASGKTAQAVREAEIARDLGYHACLASLSALKEEHEDALVAYCRAVVDSGASARVALYTGNDDTIVADLLTGFDFGRDAGPPARIRGGLLGHWGFWTRRAVELPARVHSIVEDGPAVPLELLTMGAQITDVNAAVFDPAHQFRGCIPGIHEMLRRQGLMEGTWCLNPEEQLSEGQGEEISRVHDAYPHLHDDEFVAEHLAEWLS